jgi:hypothetical protein
MQRQVEAGVEPMEQAPLVSDSGPMASMTGSPMPAGPVVSFPAARPLVGDRPVEPVVTDYLAAANPAGVPSAAPVTKQTRAPSVQQVLATTAVQRSVGVGVGVGVGAGPAAPWPPGALAVSRSSPHVGGQSAPAQLVQLPSAAPAAAESHHPPLSTKLIVQRSDDAGEPAAATNPTTATGPATATTPAPPVGSTSPTEVDSLVRRLYDPIVRRLKAELQLDRERAGHSLDLRH